jgi:hypothetical protein
MKENAKRSSARRGASRGGVRGGSRQDGLLTRHEAAKRAGISETTLRARERDGRIASVLRDGAHFYEAGAVDTLRAGEGGSSDDADGARAASVFDELAANAAPVDIVRKLKIAPPALRKLLAEWQQLQGGAYLTSSDLAALGAASADVKSAIDAGRIGAALVAALQARAQPPTGAPTARRFPLPCDEPGCGQPSMRYCVEHAPDHMVKRP